MPHEPLWAPAHQREAAPLHRLIILVFGLLALCCIGGGIVAIIWNAVSKTEFELLGARLTTGHVGVAFVGIGLLTALFTVRAVLKNQYQLGALPSPKRSRRK
jgi:hypothetical protein